MSSEYDAPQKFDASQKYAEHDGEGSLGSSTATASASATTVGTEAPFGMSKDVQSSEPRKITSKEKCQICCARFKRFVWNSDKKQFCGRSGVGWLKLIGFYIGFYALLCGYFAALLAIFYTGLNPTNPRLTGQQSLLQLSPGMGFRPFPDYTTAQITFVQGMASTYRAYTDNIAAFLGLYSNQSGSQYVNCMHGKPTSDATAVCSFPLQLLSGCLQRVDYGYAEGAPCIILKLNRIYGWMPVLNGSSGIQVTCAGENPWDVDNLGTPEYYPSNQFPIDYYPYLNQAGYLAPLIAVRFPNITRSTLVFVACYAQATNIPINNDPSVRAGIAHFELLVDQVPTALATRNTHIVLPLVLFVPIWLAARFAALL